MQKYNTTNTPEYKSPIAPSLQPGSRVGRTLLAAAQQHGVALPGRLPTITPLDLDWAEARIATWARALPITQTKPNTQ